MIIAGMGTAVPEHSVPQHDAAEIAGWLCSASDEQRDQLREIYALSGVRHRHSVLLHSSDGPVCERQSLVPSCAPVRELGPSVGDRMRRYEAEAGPLAARAAGAALDEAQLAACAITHLVTVSCTGFYAPGFD